MVSCTWFVCTDPLGCAAIEFHVWLRLDRSEAGAESTQRTACTPGLTPTTSALGLPASVRPPGSGTLSKENLLGCTAPARIRVDVRPAESLFDLHHCTDSHNKITERNALLCVCPGGYLHQTLGRWTTKEL